MFGALIPSAMNKKKLNTQNGKKKNKNNNILRAGSRSSRQILSALNAARDSYSIATYLASYCPPWILEEDGHQLLFITA